MILQKSSFSNKHNALVGWKLVSDADTFAGGDTEVGLAAQEGSGADKTATRKVPWLSETAQFLQL